MSATADRGFWVKNHLVNPVVRMILRGPLGGRAGRHLAIVGYVGRRTGQRHELVVQYARDGNLVWIVPAQPQRKTWWRNLREPTAVDLRLAGLNVHGIAVAISPHDHPEQVIAGQAAYRRAFPRATARLARQPSEQGGAREPVLVRVELEASPYRNS